MTAAPLAPGHGADGHCHAQPVALIMWRATHLGRADERSDMLRAHLHIGLEAAAAQHDRFGMIGLDAVIIANLDATDAPGIVHQQLCRGAAVADIDVHALGGLEPAP